MNYRLICCVFLILTLTGLASAQGKPGGGGGGAGSGPGRAPSSAGPSPTSTQPSMSRPDSTFGQRAYLTGKVVLDDGTQLTESANIQTICRGRKQTVTHTDSHGGFGFELGDRASAAAAGISEADVDSIANPAAGGGGGSQRDWRECELQAELPGFI